jgi:hypothetical protein
VFVYKVYDEDKPGSASLSDHDFQGSCLFTMGELMTAQNAALTKVRLCIRIIHIRGEENIWVFENINSTIIICLYTLPPAPIGIQQLVLTKSTMLGGQSSSNAGTITMHAEEMVASSEFLQLGLRGKSLANKDGKRGYKRNNNNNNNNQLT